MICFPARTKITFGERLATTADYTLHAGELNQERILITVVRLNETVYQEIKEYIKDKVKVQ